MSEQSRERELERADLERAGAERYQRYQREMRNGNRAAPQEFDANGFPVPQPRPSFIERVARLLNPL